MSFRFRHRVIAIYSSIASVILTAVGCQSQQWSSEGHLESTTDDAPGKDGLFGSRTFGRYREMGDKIVVNSRPHKIRRNRLRGKNSHPINPRRGKKNRKPRPRSRSCSTEMLLNYLKISLVIDMNNNVSTTMNPPSMEHQDGLEGGAPRKWDLNRKRSITDNLPSDGASQNTELTEVLIHPSTTMQQPPVYLGPSTIQSIQEVATDLSNKTVIPINGNSTNKFDSTATESSGSINKANSIAKKATGSINKVTAKKATGSIKKGFECDKCHRTFSNHSNMKQHQNFNCQFLKGPNLFNCSRCSTTFTQKSSLTYHLKYTCPKVEPPKPFTCSRCPTTFKQKKTLTKHQRDICQISCDYCGYKFKGEKNFKSHIESGCEMAPTPLTNDSTSINQFLIAS